MDLAVLAHLFRHLRANGIAYAALFIALSGTAVAASALQKNSVGSKQLKRGSVTAAKVKKNSLTGAQINEAKLGQVPQAANAATLDGKSASAFLAAGGKAADSERLDGVDSSIFGNTATYAGMNFEPRDSAATEKVYETTGSISCAGTSTDFTERVQLPQGAFVTGLDFRYVDNEAGGTAGLELRAYDSFEQSGAVTVQLANTSTTGASAARRTASVTLPTPIAIDNGHYSSQLNWSPFVCSANMELVGAAVHYTLPTG